MRYVVMTLLTLALLAPAAPTQAQPVTCARIVAAAPLVGGQYAGVTCPAGGLVVTLRPGQTLPAVGPARVNGSVLQARNGAYPVVR